MLPFTYPMNASKEHQYSIHKNTDGTYVLVYAYVCSVTP